jgi:putative hemolysin
VQRSEVSVAMASSVDLVIRLARTRRDVAAAQALRYRVFYREMGAAANLRAKVWRRDIDRFDRACDHLLVIDRARRRTPPWIFGQVVGTCRLMRRLLAQPGECLELGRSCVDPDYRARAVIDRLWSGIADYVQGHGVALLFGCASLPGTKPADLAVPLSYLHHFHLAPPDCRPQAVATRYVDMRLLEPDALDPRAAWAALPPLLKGYLRLGATIGDGAVVDLQFNTTDVCVVLRTERLSARYSRRYFGRPGAGVAA